LAIFGLGFFAVADPYKTDNDELFWQKQSIESMEEDSKYYLEVAILSVALLPVPG
jgi:hypothetical protein